MAPSAPIIRYVIVAILGFCAAVTAALLGPYATAALFTVVHVYALRNRMY